MNEETGNLCEAADTCNYPAGQCTPAGGGVCVDPSDVPADADNPDGIDQAYQSKFCSATCLNGSCVPVYRCSVTGVSCDPANPLACPDPPAGNTCQFVGDQCDAASINPGVACNPANDCAPLIGNAACFGGGSCNFSAVIVPAEQERNAVRLHPQNAQIKFA